MTERLPAIDGTDRRILCALQNDGRLSVRALARELTMSAPAVSDRLRRLESAGVITGYEATVNPAAVGRPVLAFIRIAGSGPKGCAGIAEFAENDDTVLECHRLTGEDCFLLKVATNNLSGLEQLVDTLTTWGKPITSLVLSSPVAKAVVVPL